MLSNERPQGLKNLLSSAYGIKSTLVKTRQLYSSGRAPIHFDQVEALGEFIEIEIALSGDYDLMEAEIGAQQLINEFGIKARQLIEVAYVDLLDAKNT